MDYFVIRNKRQLTELIEGLQSRRLPFKIVVDDIYPVRSVDMNAYYWGIVLKYISDESGHDIMECHEGYKMKYALDIKFEFNKHRGVYEPVFGVGSTAEMNVRLFTDYIFRVRVDGELEHRIVIPLPSEAFVPELDFKHDKIEERRL